ncbi:MAG: isocitrate lyase/PEP mutase family protein [Proteobacteria bacterium]|nr:isocitrate lyase/PEP mutase family protein [Pseudomonadota bacterium]
MTAAAKLQALLNRPQILVMPGVFDAMSTRLAEQAGFDAAFMGGFAVSAARIGMPDTGLISYAEMVDQGRNLCAAVDIPVIGDGDTGYGNAINVKRTVQGYAQAGFACVMIEDQVAPKRCGHTRGKQVVPLAEARQRIKSACDARDELRRHGGDILIMARTDANATDGMDEAVKRCNAFVDAGVDITFLEAPKDQTEMRRYGNDVPGPKMANMVEQGATPFLTPDELQDIGYKLAIWPVSMMLSAIKAMQETLAGMKEGRHDLSKRTTFMELQTIVGFPEYYAAEKAYAAE